MVFPSVPINLDPRPNSNQQIHQQGVAGGGASSTAPAVAIRPTSMSELARHAKIPQPDPSLKCPRCDSTNTKFCYFNNYSLSQPRHFCKTCRRYWTRGGNLRNVPVGGSYRRNKRSKSGGGSSSKSTDTADRRSGASSSSSTLTSMASGSGIMSAAAAVLPSPQIPNFMSPLQTLTDYNLSNINLNFAGILPLATAGSTGGEYQIESNCLNVGLDQWRLQPIQQFLPHQSQVEGLFSFETEAMAAHEAVMNYGKSGGGSCSSALVPQLASVKMEDNPQRLGFSPRLLYPNLLRGDQYWIVNNSNGRNGDGGGAAASGGWIDLSGFSSSSAGNNI